MSRANSPLRNRVIFVVGARRSGTNWLQRVLAAHADVVAVPSETYLFSHGLRPLRDRIHQGALASPITGSVYGDRDATLDAMRDLCDTIFTGLLRGIDPRATRIVERTPDHVRHLDLIAEVYPDAHVVHIIRDGRDVVRSLMSHSWGPDDVDQATLEWKTAITSAREHAPKLERYTELSYERLLTDPQHHIAALFEVVGLSSAPSDLEPVFAEVGVRYNADPTAPAIEVAKWRTGLSAEHVAAVEAVAGDVLDDLGYERASAGPVVATVTEPKAAVSRPSTLRRRLGRLRQGRATSDQHRLERALHLLDLFLDAARNDAERIAGLLTASVRVRIVDGDDRFEARGDSARRRLIDALATDVAMHGPQVAGQIHPSTTSATFVGEFAHDGRRHARVIVLTIHGDHIERVAYYRLGTSSLS